MPEGALPQRFSTVRSNSVPKHQPRPRLRVRERDYRLHAQFALELIEFALPNAWNF
jgi:hypothetical protein